MDNNNATNENNFTEEEMDKIYLDYFMKQLQESIDDFKNGRYTTFEETREEFRKKYEAFKLKENKKTT